MRIQAISSNLTNNKFNINKSFDKNLKNVSFGVGEDYGGVDLDKPENPNLNDPDFKDGMIGIISMLTLPVSFPIIVAREAYKDKYENKIETDIDPNNIED